MNVNSLDRSAGMAAAAAAIQARQAAASEAETQTAEVSEAEEDKSLIDRIREKGFTQFLEELEEEKKEKMREEILRKMGLTEEQLEEMPAEQRAQIEEMIAREIVERAAANSEMSGSTSSVLFQKGQMNMQRPELNVGTTIATDMGLGPLLALQEAEALEAQNGEGKEPEDEQFTG